MTLRILFLSLILLSVSCAPERISDWKRGLNHLQMEQYREAIAPLEKELARRPEQYEAQCLIGYAHEKLGEHDAALAAYTKTLVLNPVNACAFAGSGRIYAARKQWTEAWVALLQARGYEANTTQLALYPALRAAVDAGELLVTAPPAPSGADTTPRTVTVTVSVTAATLEKRSAITVTAAAPEALTPFDQAFVSLLAATAGDRIARCHDLFYAAGKPAALDERFILPLRPDGTVDTPPEDPEKLPADMKECVLTALSALRFTAQPAQ